MGYSGLGASIHASGQTERTGAITKEGRREMRTALVEAAWAAVASHPHWKVVFQRPAARIGKRKAIVAIARKLLVVIWHVLTDRVVDWYADREAVPASCCAGEVATARQHARDSHVVPSYAAS